MSTIHHIVNVSGGKDSAACYALAVQAGISFRAIFADTGHEHPLTYAYLDRLPALTGGPSIEIITADNVSTEERFTKRRERVAKTWKEKVSPEKLEHILEHLVPSGNQFLDLCKLRAGFPSHFSQFCTDRLKIQPIHKQVFQPILEVGDYIIQWLGVRREESKRRANTPMWEERTEDIVSYYPIRNWTEAQVFTFLRLRGVPANPLYAMGRTRVGCNPCIYSRQSEVALLDEAAIQKLEDWEKDVSHVASKEGKATFFPGYKPIRDYVTYVKAADKFRQPALFSSERSCQGGVCE